MLITVCSLHFWIIRCRLIKRGPVYPEFIQSLIKELIMLIGAHLSVSGGYDETLRYAEKTGCETIQIFAKTPRRWKAPELDSASAVAFSTARKERYCGMPLFTHTAYLINLATNDVEIGEKSVQALADELVRGAALSVEGVVTHLGNDQANDTQAAAQRVAKRIFSAYQMAGPAASEVLLLLENTAGAGTGFGCCPEDIGAVFSHAAEIGAVRLGVCIDTCHAHAYGADLSTPEAWSEYIDAYETACGAGCVKLIHANDCMFERGSRRDRHAWIGEGYLGYRAFESMFSVLGASGISVITEAPGEVPAKDEINIARLKSIRVSGR